MNLTGAVYPETAFGGLTTYKVWTVAKSFYNIIKVYEGTHYNEAITLYNEMITKYTDYEWRIDKQFKSAWIAVGV